MKKRTIVISAVNLTSGGPFTILKDCLQHLSENPLSQQYQVIVLVHSRKKLPDYKNLIFIEYPASKKRWIYRLYYEYRHFKKLSHQLKPWLWLSLHDITPNVKAQRQAVYMHNPTPFNRLHIKDLFHTPVYFLFTLFYKHLYKINIRRNDYLIVQQEWLRRSFSCMFRINPEKIVVAYPHHSTNPLPETETSAKKDPANYQFIYPAFPRPFKNFEVICKAAARLERKGISGFEVVLTIDGSENSYSHTLRKEYESYKSIRFTGLLSPEEVRKLYASSDCLLFPSRLETWGLPITEYTPYRKPILAADRPYAHETTAGTSLTGYFNPDNDRELAVKMKKLIQGDHSGLRPIPFVKPAAPFTRSWEELFTLLLK